MWIIPLTTRFLEAIPMNGCFFSTNGHFPRSLDRRPHSSLMGWSWCFSGSANTWSAAIPLGFWYRIDCHWRDRDATRHHGIGRNAFHHCSVCRRRLKTDISSCPPASKAESLLFRIKRLCKGKEVWMIQGLHGLFVEQMYLA